MEHLAAWAGFLGVWCLVAGPIYQANLELRAEDLAVDRIRAASKQVPAADTVSNWWWLLPPMHWVLRRRRQEAHKRMVLDVMQDEDYEALTHFVNKAVGWMVVAVGGLLIAAKETHGLCHEMNWSNVVFSGPFSWSWWRCPTASAPDASAEPNAIWPDMPAGRPPDVRSRPGGVIPGPREQDVDRPGVDDPLGRDLALDGADTAQ
jgi:hypothetical protein